MESFINHVEWSSEKCIPGQGSNTRPYTLKTLTSSMKCMMAVGYKFKMLKCVHYSLSISGPFLHVLLAIITRTFSSCS